MSSITRGFIIYTILALALTACSKDVAKTDHAPQNTQDIFSDRPLGMTTEILMVQLLSPALLEGELTPDRVAALKKEQDLFEQKLQDISAEIKILYRYRYTINGMALVTPQHLVTKIQALLEIKKSELASPLARPLTNFTPSHFQPMANIPTEDKTTSVSFLGATELHKVGIRGQGVKVGVIDTGVDYTHAMLGGSGNPEDYKAVNPAGTTPQFPNEKVVGGIDLAGSRFSGRSDLYDEKIPFPDSNPIDEQGHGTHVAGTIAGLGDGINTYDGMAPDAQIHAIKVFGKEGGTFDAIVIAGFEYAVDPNGDSKIDDRLDVVNLSLGGDYGNPKILYTKAIKNLVNSGMTVVAAAGNSGDVRSIVGAPATAEEALSVAASIDGREINWKFKTIKIFPSQGETLISDFVEGSITKPLSDVNTLRGKLVDIGLADQELSDDMKKSLQGNVALIQRGTVTFAEKIKRALEGGAIAALVYNNQDGPAIAMGSTNEADHFSIPGVMVDKPTGEKIVALLKLGPVDVDFKNPDMIEKPELIDTITEFSSRGPRTDDYGFKPQVAAPGFQILSASMGDGDVGVLNNGTSMAAPHVAGAIALLKQHYPQMTPKEYHSLLTSTAQGMNKPDSGAYLYSSQGAGRIDLLKAMQTPLLVSEPQSLGLVEVPNANSKNVKFFVKNISESPVTANVIFSGTDLRAAHPGSLTLNAGETREFEVPIQVLDGDLKDGTFTELNGAFEITGQGFNIQIPIMAFRIQKSAIIASEIKGESLSVSVVNQNSVPGTAAFFNLIETDAKKVTLPGQDWRSDACDLKSVGYRVIEKTSGGKSTPHLQFAFQLYDAKVHLKSCDFSILVDSNNDGSPDHEIIGIGNQSVYGFQGDEHFAAVLDFSKAMQMRLLYEAQISMGIKSALDFTKVATASGGIQFYQDSGLTLVDVPIGALKVSPQGSFQARIAAINNIGDALESDDFLGTDEGLWRTLETDPRKMGYFDLSDVTIDANAQLNSQIQKGEGQNRLMLYSPTNFSANEAQVVTP